MTKNQMMRFYYAILAEYANYTQSCTKEELHKRLKVGFDVILKGNEKKKWRGNRTITKLSPDQFLQYVDFVVSMFAYLGVLFNSEDYKYGHVRYRIVPRFTSF